MTDEELEEFYEKYETAVRKAMDKWREVNPNPPPRTKPVDYFYPSQPDGLHVYEIEAHPNTIAKLRQYSEWEATLIENPDMPEGSVNLGLKV